MVVSSQQAHCDEAASRRGLLFGGMTSVETLNMYIACHRRGNLHPLSNDLIFRLVAKPGCFYIGVQQFSLKLYIIPEMTHWPWRQSVLSTIHFHILSNLGPLLSPTCFSNWYIIYNITITHHMFLISYGTGHQYYRLHILILYIPSLQ